MNNHIPYPGRYEEKKMKKIISTLILIVLFTSCTKNEISLANGYTSIIDQKTNELYKVGYNFKENGELNQAIILAPGLEHKFTREKAETIPKNGVFWLKNKNNKLWIDGNKVDFPSSTKVIVVKSNGVVVPLDLSKAELELFHPDSDLKVNQDFLKTKLIPIFNKEEKS